MAVYQVGLGPQVIALILFLGQLMSTYLPTMQR